jgi:8-oxo-(d)GTP phosphatase
MPDRAAGEIHAAGAVLWRRGADGVEVALVHRPRYDDWSLPKGKRMDREHVLITAVREVWEETGVRAVLGRRLASTSYVVDGRPKRVDYWAARHAGPPGPAEAGFTPGHEVDEVAWLDPAAARGRLSYPHDVEVLDSFTAGPPDTRPIVLLRHAATVSKSQWQATGGGDDLARPLSPRGVAQAMLLAEALGCVTPCRLISSEAERCVASLRPYAGAAGAEIETEPAFTLDTVPGAPQANSWSPSPAGQKRVAEAVADPAGSVICGHRQNLPTLLAWACRQLGAPMLVGRPLPKGAFWLLQASTAGLESAERHELGV